MSHIAQALWRARVVLFLGLWLALPPLVMPTHAASSAGCEGGGFVIKGLNKGSVVGTDGATGSPAGNLGQTFLVAGRYVEFLVVSTSFGVEDWTFTGAPNPPDLTGGKRTVVFAAKPPGHRGHTLITGT